MNLKYNEWKISGSESYHDDFKWLGLWSLCVQFSIEKQYWKRTYQIETFFSEENWQVTSP